MDTNGFSRLPADKIIDKKGTGEFKSVTGGFLEEVCSLISLKNSDSHTVNTGDRWVPTDGDVISSKPLGFRKSKDVKTKKGGGGDGITPNIVLNHYS